MTIAIIYTKDDVGSARAVAVEWGGMVGLQIYFEGVCGCIFLRIGHSCEKKEKSRMTADFHLSCGRALVDQLENDEHLNGKMGHDVIERRK